MRRTASALLFAFLAAGAAGSAPAPRPKVTLARHPALHGDYVWDINDSLYAVRLTKSGLYFWRSGECDYEGRWAWDGDALVIREWRKHDATQGYLWVMRPARDADGMVKAEDFAGELVPATAGKFRLTKHRRK